MQSVFDPTCDQAVPETAERTFPDHLAQRVREIRPFHAAMLMQDANDMRDRGIDVISMGIGEPDFPAPEPVIEALIEAARAGHTGYTNSLGIWPLREAIAEFYNREYASQVNPEQVIVTNGASGALIAATLTGLNPGDQILMPDPAYPGNRNFVLAAGAEPVMIPCGPEESFQLTLEKVKAHWGPRTQGVLLASPGNPTSTSVCEKTLVDIIDFVHAQGGFVLMDEIYLGLQFNAPRRSALAHSHKVWVINSFSKYFQMTGWRLGWMIVPPQYVDGILKVVANIAICAPTLSQYAALACFKPDVLPIYEARRAELKKRLDFVVQSLESMGISVPCKPDGAFYIYANIARFTDDSYRFALDLLAQQGLLVVPGIDFGDSDGHHWIRLSYAISMEKLQDAMARLRRFVQQFR